MKKDTNLRERIEQILSETKWKQTTLSEQTGIPVQFFADCKRGKSKSISREYAEMIHNALPQYDIDWIKAGIAIDGADKSIPASVGQFSTDATSMSQLTTVNAKTDLQPQPNDSSVSAMEEQIKKRVRNIMNGLNISVNSLAKDGKLKQNTLNEQINGASRVSVAAVAALLYLHPEISADWLLRGKEPMIVQPDEEMSDETRFYMSRHIKEMEIQSVEQQNRIEELENNINRLNREIDGLYDRIDELKRATSIAAPHSVMAV